MIPIPLTLLQVSANNACSLFGGSNYVNAWLPINIVVLLLALTFIAVFYSFGKLLPGSTASKFTAVARNEITQVMLAVIVLVILVAASGAACQVTSNALSVTGSTGQDPIAFAETYVLHLVGYDGLGLLTNLYAYHFAYSVIAGVFSQFSQFIAAWLPSASYGQTFKVSYNLGYDISLAYGYMSNLYLAIFAPLVIVATALMYIQYVLLVFFQATSFLLILPVALVMRVIPFGGASLRNAANSVLAIAIASYIVFPLAISFGSYALTWMFTSCGNGSVAGTCNPSAVYMTSLLCFSNGAIQPCSEGGVISNSSLNIPGLQSTFFGFTTPSPYQVLSGGVGSAFWSNIDPATAVQNIHVVTDWMALFMFTTFMMSTLTFAITIAFAMGLARALNSGVEGAASFWSSM